MAYTTNDGARLYWEASGSGDPLLLIQGLGYSAEMWYRVVPALERHFRVIRYDARGVGRSDVPEGPYPIELMASDAIAILDAVEEPTAHVLGVSLGGIVAQEVALSHPERVWALILLSTHPGGKDTIWPAKEILDLLRARATMPFDEAVRAAVDHAYFSAPRDRIEEDIQKRIELPTSGEGYQSQLMSGLNYPGTGDRLGQISIPTLVITGDRDLLVPPANSDFLAGRIPNAKHEVIKDCGHVSFTDQPEALSGAIVDFLESVAADDIAR